MWKHRILALVEIHLRKKKRKKEKHEWSKFCPSIQLYHSFKKHGRGRQHHEADATFPLMDHLCVFTISAYSFLVVILKNLANRCWELHCLALASSDMCLCSPVLIPVSQESVENPVPQSYPHLYVCVLSHFRRVQLCATLWTVVTRLLCPWDSPGKNTGVGCCALLQTHAYILFLILFGIMGRGPEGMRDLFLNKVYNTLLGISEDALKV